MVDSRTISWFFLRNGFIDSAVDLIKFKSGSKLVLRGVGTHIKMASTSEILEKSRDHIETGAKVVITVEANLEADQLKLLARSVAPIDATIARTETTGLRLFVKNPQTISSKEYRIQLMIGKFFLRKDCVNEIELINNIKSY